MKLNRFYENKDNHTIIHIEGFANHIDSVDDSIVIFKKVFDAEKLSCCFSGPKYFATQEELLSKYVLIENEDNLFKNITLKELLV